MTFSIEPQIRVLGRDNKEVGNNLEILAKELLSRLGFGAFIRNAYRTGEELDLKARHRVTNTPLVCECKARSKPLDAHSVRLFHSQWEKERKRDPRLFGMIISVSGFTGTAKEWYEEFDGETKRDFRLIDADELLTRLIEVELTLAPQAIIVSLDQKYSIGKLQNYWLTFSSHGLAWFYEFALDGKPEFFTVVDGNGEALPTWKCRELLDMIPEGQLLGLRLFGIDLREKVQLELLKAKAATVSHLAEEIQESEVDVKLALDILQEQGVVEQQGETYYFIRDVVAFVTVAKAFITSHEAVTFLSAQYAQEMIHSAEFISYVDNRFRLGMTSAEQEITARLMALSPSALHHVLTADTSQYINTSKDIERVFDDSATAKEKAKWLEIHRTSLLQQLIIYAVHDIVGNKYPLSSHFSGLGIQRYRVRARLDAIGNQWKTLTAKASMMYSIMKAGESIAAGSFVSTTEPINAYMLDGLLYLEAEDYEDAKKSLQAALNRCESSEVSIEQYQAVLSNYALVFMREGCWNDALALLLRALALGTPKSPIVFTNALLCYVNLDDQVSAFQLMEEAKEVFPELVNSEIYQMANDKLSPDRFSDATS